MSAVVTQADRERAAAFSEAVAGKTNGHDQIAECRAGKRDDTFLVQAFALHRSEAVEELVEVLAEAAAELRDFLDGYREHSAAAVVERADALLSKHRGEQG